MPKSTNPKVALNVAVLLMLSLFTQVLPRPAITSANAAPKTETTSPANEVGLSKPEPAPTVAPEGATLSATLTDNIVAGTKVAPGGTINYTAVITNSAATSPAEDATNVNFSAPLDANTTLVAGSVHASPIAFNNTYSWVGNTFLDTSARSLPTVIANDVAVNPPGGTDTFTVTTQSNADTALLGKVTLASDGHFTYTPPVGRPNGADGASVNDTFTYTIANSADPLLTATGTVTITLTGRVWYLQAGGVGDGRSNTPSGSPSAMSTAADKSTDILYVMANAGALNGAFTLDGGQQLLGAGIALTVNAIPLIPVGTAPTITNTGGNVVTLNGTNGSNTVSGLVIGDSSGIDLTGANFGTLTTSNLTLNGTGRPLGLTTGTLAATFNSISTTSAIGGPAISLTGTSGTLTTTSTSITSGSQGGITMSNTVAGSTVNLGNTTVTGTAATALNLTTNFGSFTFGDLDLSPNSGAPAITCTNTGPITSTSGTIVTTNARALEISTCDLNMFLDSVTAAGSTDAAIKLTGVTGTLTMNGGTLTGNASAPTFQVSAGTANVTYNGAITQNNAARVIDIQSKTAGTITFGGAISSTGSTGIFLNSNTGATINFTGGISLSTGTNAAFTATGGGTVNVSNTDGTVSFARLDSLGSGYTSPPTVTLTGGGGSGATASAVGPGILQSVRMNVFGSGYTSPPTVTLTGGGGSGATAVAFGPGTVKQFSLTNGGSGYSSAPTVTLTGGGGSGATAVAFVNGGAVDFVAITNPGSGYTSAPSVGFSGGGGSAAAATAQLRTQVVEVNLTNPGSGYTSAPTVGFSGGGGSGAVATAVVRTSVIGLNITNPGSGYTSAPTVGFSGGGGSGASATAFLTAGSTLTTTTGIALNIANTTIGSGGLMFKSISANGGANGVVLNSTGSTAGLTITGNGGSCSSAVTCTGGAIQNTSGGGISLTTTQKVVLDRMFIQNTGQSGVGGTGVVDFTLTNSRIDNSGTTYPSNPKNDSNVGFGFETGVNPPDNNVSGVITIIGNTLTNPAQHGVDIDNFAGTISNATIVNNVITSFSSSSTPGASSHGSGIRLLGFGHGGGTSNITKATISENTINKFPGGGGITAQYGNSVGAGGTWGTPGDPTNVILIQNNRIDGESPANAMGTNAILGTLFGNGTAAWKIDNNRVSNQNGTQIGIGMQGPNPTGRADITNNQVRGIIDVGAQAIAVSGTFQTVVSDAPQVSATIIGNAVTEQDGEGIIALATAGSAAHLDVSIKNNNIAAPNFGGNRFGMTAQVGSAGADTTGTPSMCLDMSGNTAAGVGVNTGIGIRKKTAGFVFNIEGFGSGDPTAFLQGQNPAGGGVTMVSQTTGFLGCATAPRPAPGDEASNPTESNPATALAMTPSEAPKLFIGAEQPGTLHTAAITLSADGKVQGSYAAPAVPVKTTSPKSTKNGSRDVRLSHHAVRNNFKATSQQPNAPTSGENVTINTVATLPAGGKSITIKYSATVNTTVLTSRLATTQGTVTANAGAISVLTDDPEPAGAANPTATSLDTTLTWTGATDTNWNDATNWTRPGPVVSSYAPGVSNPAVNDVAIPNAATAQPNVGTSDIGIFSLSITNGRTLTIGAARTLTIGSTTATGGSLTLNGIISGGFLNFGNGTHTISNAFGTGSLSSTNVATVLSGSIVTLTLSNNLQMGTLAINSGGSMTIFLETLSLNGAGAALVVPAGATFTTTGGTLIFNGTAAQQAPGIAYGSLTINNTLGTNVTGVTLTGNATVNGNLTLTSSDLDTGAFTLTQPNTSPTAGVSDVVGTVKRTGGPFAPAVALTFGNPNNRITFDAVGTRPTDMTVNLVKAVPTGGGMGFPSAVQRTYTITPTGGSGFTGTLRLHYLDTELNGNTEGATLHLWRFNSGVGRWQKQTQTGNDTAANWVEKTGVAQFSPWTLNSSIPSAANSSISGHITGANGDPLGGVVVGLSNGRRTITRADGNYQFDEVPTGELYTLTPMLANHSFTPHTRSFSLVGNMTDAAFAGSADGSQTANPLDTDMYFVRQQYLDFLGREPDEPGLQFWASRISSCLDDQVCIHNQRIDVSAQFFITQEFQLSGSYIYDLYQGSLGRRPTFTEYSADRPQVIGGSDLDTQKAKFTQHFVERPEFVSRYQGATTAEMFVDALIQNVQQVSGVDLNSQRAGLIASYQSGLDQINSRTLVVRAIADDAVFRQSQYNKAFVLMEYFDYLQRDIDQNGYDFWLDVLNQGSANNYRGMVCSFLTSAEYQRRFATVVTHSNADCGQ